jgi:hypothetical protein
MLILQATGSKLKYMRKILLMIYGFIFIASVFLSLSSSAHAQQTTCKEVKDQPGTYTVNGDPNGQPCVLVDTTIRDEFVPSASAIYTFLIRLALVLSTGILLLDIIVHGLIYLNEKDKDWAKKHLEKAGIVLFVILFIAVFAGLTEQYVFQKRVCFGVTCPITLPRPQLIQPD